MIHVTPHDFVPRDWDGVSEFGAPPEDPKLRHRDWIPGLFSVVEDVEPYREAHFAGEGDLGEAAEAAGFGSAEVEVVRETTLRHLRPARAAVTLPKWAPVHKVVDQVGRVLVSQNTPPQIFRRRGTLVRYEHDEADRPLFREMAQVTFQVQLSRMAEWWQLKKTREELDEDEENEAKPIQPPYKELGAVLKDPPLTIPVAVGIVTAPVLRPDGSLLRNEGFDPATRLLYERPYGLSPTKYRSVEDAMAKIDEMLIDFPFARDHDRANFLAWLVSPAVRPYVGLAPTPVFLFSAPTPGTGKDLLAGTASLIYAGAASDSRPLPGTEDEVRKELVAALIAGRQLLIYTNVSGILDSDSLAGVVTSTQWSGRRLGESTDVSFEVQLTVGITANNLILGRDWNRRVVEVRLDARDPTPWTRRNFAHGDLPAWILGNRNDLLGAVLHLCESWVADGARLDEDATFSSYSRWASVIGGVLAHAGVKGFLQGDAADLASPDDEPWWLLFDWWHEKFGDRWVTAKEVTGTAPFEDVDLWPPELLTANGARPEDLAVRLGRHLRGRVDTMTSEGLRLEASKGRSRGSRRWRVATVATVASREP